MHTLNSTAQADQVALSSDVTDALETCEELIAANTPNFLRVAFNAQVAQTCVALQHYASPLLRRKQSGKRQLDVCPSFLANSVDEALSGAVKLARFTQAETETDSVGVLLFDPQERFPFFSRAKTETGSAEFIPGVFCCQSRQEANFLLAKEDVQVLIHTESPQTENDFGDEFERAWNDSNRTTIRIVGVSDVTSSGNEPCDFQCDIVVFDESFVNNAVPFAAFTATHAVYSPWMRGRMSMFHSTTFQPNAIAANHFLRCLESRDPETIKTLNRTHKILPRFDDIPKSVTAIAKCYDTLYSPSFAKLIHSIGFARRYSQASGAYFQIGTQRVFDGVAGVACSLRGHNPTGWTSEISHTLKTSENPRERLRNVLQQETGLAHFVPATSGAAAVENALKLGLVSQKSRDFVLVLKGGFGGKTLCALTGTSRPGYRKRIGPLYSRVVYADPFAPYAEEQIRGLLQQYPIGMVQMELIQGVGGVRQIPTDIAKLLDRERENHDYLLFVDEVQTGMYRTGPFLRSSTVGISPDLVAIGKGTSDMMFPSSFTLYNDRVHQRVVDNGCHLPDWLHQRHASNIPVASLLNTIQRATLEHWPQRIKSQAAQFSEKLLPLMDRPGIRDVRIFGMLMGLELAHDDDAGAGLSLRHIVRSRAAKLFAFDMLKDTRAPLLMGFCQYEPQVLKFSPTLILSDEDIAAACQTICTSLSKPLRHVATTAMLRLATNRLKSAALSLTGF